MDKNPFLKYLIRDKKEDILHSSAYAKMQSGESMGVGSMQSFEERQKIEANRQRVRRYSDSSLMQRAAGNAPRAKVYVKPADTGAGQSRIASQRTMPGTTKK